MLRLPKKQASHEELFLSRYPELLSWSMQITGRDRNKATDLVHDAYVHWMLARPDCASIQNLDGYFYGMLRNMHSAEMRRAFRASAPLSVIEYDSAFLSLDRAVDEEQATKMRRQLVKVCDYACERKESCKAGSFLLLRFFHGYYPSEAARIGTVRRVAVDSWLRVARNEARVYLEHPESLKFIKEKHKSEEAFSFDKDQMDFLEVLSQRIFQSCRGTCLSDKSLRAVYAQGESNSLDAESLAHISSCQSCLTRVAEILGLPAKDDGDPPKWLGRDPQPGENSKKRKLVKPQNLRSYLDDVIEHRPNELHIAVNGFTVGTQKVISERIEHSLKVSLLEQIGLVEVLSEQGIRLLCLYVEAPPEGAIEQWAEVHLSDDRTLRVTLKFQDQWPSLELTYSDPHFAEVLSDPETIETLDHGAALPVQNRTLRVPFQKLFSFMKAKPRTAGFWLKPAIITVLLIVFGLALYLVHKPAPPPLPADVLARAEAIEQQPIAAGAIGHRRISYEERSGQGSPKRRTIELWQGPNGKRARRLFDDHGALVAGAWKDDSSNSQNVFYHHGAKLKIVPLGESATPSIDHLWLVDPSAVTFAEVVKGMESEGLRIVDNRYVLSYRKVGFAQHQETSLPQLTRAALSVDRSSLHALSEVLTFGDGADQREFVLTELSFEALPARDVSTSVFQPDPELLAPVESAETTIPSTLTATKPLAVVTVRPPSPAELAALEVNVLYLLDRINANSGEQIEVRRFPGKQLVVEAIVETEKRKTEILGALATVAGNPLIRVDVLTLEEALRRQTTTQRSAQTLDRVVITADRIPLYDEVRSYIEKSNRPAGDVDTEIQRFSGRMIDQSRQALLHAFALKHMVERFSSNDLHALDQESQRKLHEMIRTHAKAFRQSVGGLRRDLAPIFSPEEPSDTETVPDLKTDSDVIEAVKSLLNFASATDDAVSRAFAISPDTKPVLNTPSSPLFWRSLNRADALAAALERIP
jgi:DNA-directed RNA polymerase specialized sigma24 family protein